MAEYRVYYRYECKSHVELIASKRRVPAPKHERFKKRPAGRFFVV